MPLEDFDIQEDLGKGSFGCVVKAVRLSDKEVYAMKQIKIQKLKEKDKLNALNEIRFLASIECPYVVSYKEAFYDMPSERLCIVMEYANEGDLQHKIKKHITNKTRFSESEIWRVGFHVLEGLMKLHESNIIHRDIKPANIFFHNGRAKVGDLNVAKHLKDAFTATQTGTPYYASPEVWSEAPYNYKSDVWSIGCVLYQMAVLKPPFRAESPEKLFKKIMAGEYEKIGSPYSKELCLFISKLMTHDQHKRPSAKEMLNDPMLLNVPDNDLELDVADERLLQTIKFPKNLQQLNENLPKPKYTKPTKAARFAEDENNSKLSAKETSKSELRSVVSEKHLPSCTSSSKIQIGKTGSNMPTTSSSAISVVVRKPKALIRLGSQKLIF